VNQLHTGRTSNGDVWQLLTRARRRRRVRVVATCLLVVAVGTAALIAVGTFAANDLAETREVAGPPRTQDRKPTALLDPAHPFASTPAADWADGADGFVLPSAVAVGDFDVAEVTSALAAVRDVLVASRLDQALLVHHDPATFLGLLAPDASHQLAPLFGTDRQNEVASLVSLIDPNSPLLPVEPKVDGAMTVREGSSGELVVHTNYVFVYAFQPTGPVPLTSAMDVLVVVRADVDYVLRAGQRWSQGSQGLWYGAASGHVYSISCSAYRAGLLAPAQVERSVAAPDEPGVYFDPASPLPGTGGCPH
jgi:hypothetical protein